MHRCRVCGSNALFDARSLPCGHQFCKECILALLPSLANNLISILPHHIAVIICPRCQQRCEYSNVHGEIAQPAGGGIQQGHVARAYLAPSQCTDEVERQRQHKRAQFLQEYRREHDDLSRKSRSRFYNLLEEGQEFNPRRTYRDGNSPRSSGTGRRTRLVSSGPIRRGKRPRRLGQGVDDVRAMDHVNGRFVACTIIPGPGHTPHESSSLPAPRPIGASSPRAARALYRDISRPGRPEFAMIRRAEASHCKSMETTKSCCLASNLSQGIVAGMFVLLLILIVVMTSVMAGSSGQLYD